MLVETQVRHANIFNNDLMTEEYAAWTKHCGKFYDALVDLIIDTKTILVENIVKANDLITDIQMLTTQVPINGNNVDMTNELFYWLSMTEEGHYLKSLFSPPEV